MVGGARGKGFYMSIEAVHKSAMATFENSWIVGILAVEAFRLFRLCGRALVSCHRASAAQVGCRHDLFFHSRF